MAKTALSLIRSVGSRSKDLTLSTATSTGLVTQLIDTRLNDTWPVDLGTGETYFMPYVYCYSGTLANMGMVRRGRSWAQSGSTLTLLGTGFPAATAIGDTFEINLRYDRANILEAINSALAELNLYCEREIVDESITTVNGEWSYTLPAQQYWARIKKVEIQINTDTAYPTYPYADGGFLNWTTREAVNPTTGAVTWTLQFGAMPMPGRKLRIFGDAYFPDLVANADILTLSGEYERAATEWVLDYATCNLQLWQALQEPAGLAERYRRTKDDLLRQAQGIKNLLKPRGDGVVVTPGRGTGTYSPFPSRGRGQYLNALGILSDIGN